MKKLIITSLLSLTTIFCLSQDIYKVNIKSLEVGHSITDSTSTWSDSILVVLPTILIYQDSLVIKHKNGDMVYTLLGKKNANPGVNSFYSVDENTKKSYVVTYFTSPCVDNITMTVIVDDGKNSYNYYGKVE